ncbi:DUF547 domain-containing protein [Fibrobacterota bacterium]
MLYKALPITLLIGTLAFSFDLTYKKYDEFLAKYVCNNGVVYSKLSKDNITDVLAQELSSLSKAEYDKLNEANKIAYLINVYNFYTILLIKQNYPVTSIRKTKKPWDTQFVPLFGKKVSLNYIEHEVLRKQFDEPRIHFALVCASIGCPSISDKAFIGSKLDQQLDEVAKTFLNDKAKNRVEGNKLFLSKIFEWYGDDFKKKHGGFKNYVISVLGLKGKYTIKFTNYDWNLNEVSDCK